MRRRSTETRVAPGIITTLSVLRLTASRVQRCMLERSHDPHSRLIRKGKSTYNSGNSNRVALHDRFVNLHPGADRRFTGLQRRFLSRARRMRLVTNNTKGRRSCVLPHVSEQGWESISDYSCRAWDARRSDAARRRRKPTRAASDSTLPHHPSASPRRPKMRTADG